MVNLNQTSSSTWLPGVFGFIFSVNIFLSVTATLGNALILVALHKDSSLHPPTKLLFRCLALTDLCVGLISQPLFGNFIFRMSSSEIADVREDKLIGISSYILCGISVLTATAISVDRLLALLLGLRYRQVVTVRRVCAVIVSFWLIAGSCGLIRLWSYPVSKFASIIGTVLSVITSIFSYTKIYFTLRQHQAQVHVNQGLQPANASGIPPLNIARYKKTVSSIAWVQLALLACYVPFVIGSILLDVFQNMIIYVVFLSTATLVYLNSSLNPFLYCWKIGEVRQAVKETIRQFKCSCN